MDKNKPQDEEFQALIFVIILLIICFIIVEFSTAGFKW